MQQVVFAPLVKSLAIAAALVGANVVHDATTTHPVTHRLALHAPNPTPPPGYVTTYLSAFLDGDIDVTFHDGNLHPLTFRVRATLGDGCRWLGTERLVPIDDETFAYDYSETILDCDAGATPALKTPRAGIVTVVD